MDNLTMRFLRAGLLVIALVLSACIARGEEGKSDAGWVDVSSAVVQKLAEIRGSTADAMDAATTANAQKLFSLTPDS